MTLLDALSALNAQGHGPVTLYIAHPGVPMKRTGAAKFFVIPFADSSSTWTYAAKSAAGDRRGSVPDTV
ncbi:hypothetical protein ACNAW0_28255 [Micromonospora sp. SL1-18]|uniref:hypothetical protein n=1 Tax=Micromonospora sp. SL1-18 TaxID=3399128 RepID=UPI003A4DB938